MLIRVLLTNQEQTAEPTISHYCGWRGGCSGDLGCEVRDAGGHVESGMHRGGADYWTAAVCWWRWDGPADQPARVPRHAAGTAPGAVQTCRRVLQHHDEPPAILQRHQEVGGRRRQGQRGRRTAAAHWVPQQVRNLPVSARRQEPRRGTAQDHRTRTGRHGPPTSGMIKTEKFLCGHRGFAKF